MRKLFISFSGLINALANGKITESDLATGLFYFGCTLNHALHPGKHGAEYNDVERWYEGEELEKRRRAHKMIVKHIRRALKEHRAYFRAAGTRNSNYWTLAKLLERNKIGTLNVNQIRYPYDYNYPTVTDSIAKQALYIETVWR